MLSLIHRSYCRHGLSEFRVIGGQNSQSQLRPFWDQHEKNVVRTASPEMEQHVFPIVCGSSCWVEPSSHVPFVERAKTNTSSLLGTIVIKDHSINVGAKDRKRIGYFIVLLYWLPQTKSLFGWLRTVLTLLRMVWQRVYNYDYDYDYDYEWLHGSIDRGPQP